MKKKGLSLYISEQENDPKTVKELQQGLEQMEQVFPVFTPDLNWFEQKIEQTRKNSRKKLLQDLAIFWLIAISLVLVSFMLVYRTPIIYFVVQMVVLLVFIITNVVLHRRKQVERQ